MPTALRRILVVDDVPDNVAVLFDFLRSHGFKMLASESGRHALSELSQIAPDLIILDVMMPEMDGFETCRRIKADPNFSHVPIFFMTALSDPVDKVRGLQAGAVDYITKPIFPQEVLARIRVHLDLRDARQALLERAQELSEQNEKLDAAIQLRRRAEHALHESLDRAVLVADTRGQLLFIAAAAAKLLQRYVPNYHESVLPAEIAAWLAQPNGGSLTLVQGARHLELTCTAAKPGTTSRLVYLDEKAPPAAPEMLQVLGLTPREAEILFWVAQGKTSPEVGGILGSSPATVKKHVENITRKLGVETRLAAALRAMEILGAPI